MTNFSQSRPRGDRANVRDTIMVVLRSLNCMATLASSTLTLSLLVCQKVEAAIQIPKSLNQSDRREALKIVGLGTASKILSAPYPLGGYLGFEIGVSIENLPTEDLGRLGATLSQPQQDTSLPKFTFGKGLYNNVDFFIQFTPYNRQDEIAQFGGIVRWTLYQASSLPLTASVVGHFNRGNIGNRMTTRSYGLDLIGGVNASNVGLFAGLGFSTAQGSFTGGPQGVTDTGVGETESVSGLRSVMGVNVRLANYFFALQLDRYSIPVFSGKLGVRF